ncbi:MAG: hypothetical protein IID45_12075, partial [Planctomycetes bacterium]|nr:hypothetical protein [Planctomycetota bacterium]
MIASLAIYLVTLLCYLPGLIFACHRRRMLRFPVTTFTFLGLFIFNVVGSVFVIIPELTGRADFYRTEYFLLLCAQAGLFYLVAFPYVAIARTNDRPVEIKPGADRCFLTILIALIVSIVALYLVRVGTPPLIAIIKGGLSLPDIIRLRTNTIYGLPEFWLYNLGFTTIPLMAAIFALAMRATSPKSLPRARWIILACLCVNLLPGGKGNVLDFCTSLLVAYFLITGWCGREDRHAPLPGIALSPERSTHLKFSYKKTAFYLAAAFLPVLLMYKIYLGPMVEFGDLLSQVVFRIVGVYSESMAAAVVYVEQNGTLGGASLPTIRGLLSHDRMHLDSEMHIFMFGAAGSVTLSGPAEGFINFGWIGFAVMSVLTFGAMIVVEEVLKNMRRTILSITLLAFYSALATKAAQISLFAVFVSLTYVSLAMLLCVVRKSIGLLANTGRAVDGCERLPVSP